MSIPRRPGDRDDGGDDWRPPTNGLARRLYDADEDDDVGELLKESSWRCANCGATYYQPYSHCQKCGWFLEKASGGDSE